MSHGHHHLKLFCDFPECPCLNLVSSHRSLFHDHNAHVPIKIKKTFEEMNNSLAWSLCYF